MIDYFLIAAAVLLIISVAASKVSDRFGIPSLIIFLAIGMLAGSDGIGGIYFDDAVLAQSLGTIALVIILFSGGLDTDFSKIRSVRWQGISLATLGVIITALLVGVFAHWILKIGLMEGILLGSIVSSTDAAAVFSVLRSRGVHLKGKLKPLLELESGSNDPVAVFLTISIAQIILSPERSLWMLIPLLFKQMLIGLVAGYLLGRAAVFLMNKIKLNNSGLYPVIMIGIALLVYSATTLLGGSGFLAVYLAGLMMSREEFVHKRSVIGFFDGIAWLMQICMFLALGLLVFPSRMVNYWLPALLISVFLILIARPASVLISLLPFRMPWREKLFVSWVGLRGAVPIILAIYPRTMGLPNSDLYFNIVFFVVLTSVLLQGTSLPFAAKLLKVLAPAPTEHSYPIEQTSGHEWPGVLYEIQIPPDSWAIGKAIYELHLPAAYLVVLIRRGKDFVIPNGGVVIHPGDQLLGLSKPETHVKVEADFKKVKIGKEKESSD